MPLCDKEGLFIGTVIEKSLAETGPNNLLTFIVRFSLTEEIIDDQPQTLKEPLDATAWLYFFKVDGTANDVAIKMIQNAFEWPTNNPKWLMDSDLPRAYVLMRPDTYKGKTKQRVYKIGNINQDVSGMEGGIPRLNENQRNSLYEKYATKFRAIIPSSGTAPVPAPLPSAPPPLPTQTEPQAKSKILTQQDAWSVWCENHTAGDVIGDWTAMIEKVAKARGKTPDKFGPFEWDCVGNEIPF